MSDYFNVNSLMKCIGHPTTLRMFDQIIWLLSDHFLLSSDTDYSASFKVLHEHAGDHYHYNWKFTVSKIVVKRSNNIVLRMTGL